MFKKHSVQMKLVKTPKVDPENACSPKPRLNPEELKVLKDTVKGVGIYLVLAVVTFKAADAICEIAVNYAPKKY